MFQQLPPPIPSLVFLLLVLPAAVRTLSLRPRPPGLGTSSRQGQQYEAPPPEITDEPLHNHEPPRFLEITEPPVVNDCAICYSSLAGPPFDTEDSAATTALSPPSPATGRTGDGDGPGRAGDRDRSLSEGRSIDPEQVLRPTDDASFPGRTCSHGADHFHPACWQRWAATAARRGGNAQGNGRAGQLCPLCRRGVVPGATLVSTSRGVEQQDESRRRTVGENMVEWAWAWTWLFPGRGRAAQPQRGSTRTTIYAFPEGHQGLRGEGASSGVHQLQHVLVGALH